MLSPEYISSLSFLKRLPRALFTLHHVLEHSRCPSRLTGVHKQACSHPGKKWATYQGRQSVGERARGANSPPPLQHPCPAGSVDSRGCHDLWKTKPALPSGARSRARTAQPPETGSPRTRHDAGRDARRQDKAPPCKPSVKNMDATRQTRHARMHSSPHAYSAHHSHYVVHCRAVAVCHARSNSPARAAPQSSFGLFFFAACWQLQIFFTSWAKPTAPRR